MRARLSLGLAMVVSLPLVLSGCMPDTVLKLPVAFAPRSVADGWEAASAVEAGFDEAKLRGVYERFYAEDAFPTSKSLLIVRKGKLVAEAYARKEAHATQLHHIKSASKSVTSLLLGIALAQGHLTSLDQKAYDLIPEAFDGDPEKRAITLGDLVTMRSGLSYQNHRETTRMMIDEPESSLKFILERPRDHAPGAVANYSDGDVHLLAGIIQKAVGRNLEDFAREALFEPLGITDVKWEKHRDTIPYGAYGLYLHPRDMAKLGQLCLQRGMWNGKPIVPAQWIDDSVQPRVTVFDSPYGYYWWVRPELGGYCANGHGGQYIYVVPGKDLVVVHTAEPYTYRPSFGVTLEQIEDLVREIVAAVET